MLQSKSVWALLPSLVFFMALLPLPAAGGPETETEVRPGDLEFTVEVVAGGPDDFMEVRRIVLRGSNFEIGRKLGEIARTRHNTGPIPYPLPDQTRAQREYFEANYPLLLERMKGVAAAFGLDLADDGWNFSGLFYDISLAGCSVVFYPPGTTETGEGVLSRNFDFTTGTFAGLKPAEGQAAACGRPYIIEMYPDEGYASIVTCCFDLLTGVMDGVNSEGLTVAILSDNDVISELGLSPFMGFKAGFNETQIMRCLLDTCADAEEARQVLENAVLYYNTAPYHYIVADRHGHAFLWENAPDMERGHVIEGAGSPLVTTNFLLHRHPRQDPFPGEEHPLGWFSRYREIEKRLRQTAPPYDLDFIIGTNRCVSFSVEPDDGQYASIGTLWHAIYSPSQRGLKVDFYLGQDGDGGVRRSGYLKFALER